MLFEEEQTEIVFTVNRSSTRWIKSFSVRNKLSYRRIQQLEAVRLSSITKDHISQHISHVQTSMNRYNITPADRIFNMDQSGSSLEKMVGRSLRKVFVNINEKKQSIALQKTIAVKGKLHRVTFMPVVSADGSAYNPIIAYSRKLPHYHMVNGKFETFHDLLPEFNL